MQSAKVSQYFGTMLRIFTVLEKNNPALEPYLTKIKANLESILHNKNQTNIEKITYFKINEFLV